MNGIGPVQVKICGITTPEDAVMCLKHGADALGLVFYPKSPRFVTDQKARAVVDALPSPLFAVGVFVDEPAKEVASHAKAAGIGWVQLHGRETPETVEELRSIGIKVIKVLFLNREPFFSDHVRYRPDAFLAECAGEKLPGGNAKIWDWSRALGATGDAPMILAGGLSPENAASAIESAGPDAVDVSSSVELSYGIKDESKVRAFMNAVRSLPPRNTRRIFL